MSNIIYPRSPRETMDGWSYLPRYIDKIRLHLAGKLHADYQENLGKGDVYKRQVQPWGRKRLIIWNGCRRRQGGCRL